MFGDLDRPLNASRGLSAIAEFLVLFNKENHISIRICVCLVLYKILFEEFPDSELRLLNFAGRTMHSVAL